MGTSSMSDDQQEKPKYKPVPPNSWPKGTSGNPGGRPKSMREVSELARHMCPNALRRLYQIVLDPKSPQMACVAAAREILDRGLGRASLTGLTIPVDTDLSAIDGSDMSGLSALLARARFENNQKCHPAESRFDDVPDDDLSVVEPLTEAAAPAASTATESPLRLAPRPPKTNGKSR